MTDGRLTNVNLGHVLFLLIVNLREPGVILIRILITPLRFAPLRCDTLNIMFNHSASLRLSLIVYYSGLNFHYYSTSLCYVTLT